jgi:type I restriction-modification system DNA methylase subunit
VASGGDRTLCAQQFRTPIRLCVTYKADMLGDAYEYLIKQFADDAGKKGGEFYTPKGVVQLVVG